LCLRGFESLPAHQNEINAHMGVFALTSLIFVYKVVITLFRRHVR
jgi:hypothetical protein